MIKREKGKHLGKNVAKQTIVRLLMDNKKGMNTGEIKEYFKTKHNFSKNKNIYTHLTNLKDMNILSSHIPRKGETATWKIRHDFIAVRAIYSLLPDTPKEKLSSKYFQKSVNEEFLEEGLFIFTREIQHATHTKNKLLLDFDLKDALKPFTQISRSKEHPTTTYIFTGMHSEKVTNILRSSPRAFDFFLHLSQNSRITCPLLVSMFKQIQPWLQKVFYPLIKEIRKNPNKIPSTEEVEKITNIEEAVKELLEDFKKEPFLLKVLESLLVADILEDDIIESKFITSYLKDDLFLVTDYETLTP